MTITNITKVGKKYLITFSNDTNISVSQDVIVELRLYKGSNVDIKHLKTLQKFYDYYLLAVTYCQKIVAIYDVKDFLLKKGCHDIEAIIEKLIQNRFLDDNRYAQYKANSLLRKGYGKNYIISYLKTKQITDFSFEIDEEAEIDEVVEKYLKKYPKKTQKRVIDDLVRKGFAYDLVVQTVSNFPRDNDLLSQYYDKYLKKYQKKYSNQELKHKIIQSLMTVGFKYEDIFHYFEEVENE